MLYTFIKTPAGEILCTGDGKVITGMHWKVFARAPRVQPDWVEDKTLFTSVIRQLEEYFAGERQEFDFEYNAAGTDFQKQVWQELIKIPFGQSTSYGHIAAAIGKPRAVRAVGTAVGSNPISIAVPCHRVLTGSQGIGGYAGGIESKKMLLGLEGIAVKA